MVDEYHEYQRGSVEDEWRGMNKRIDSLERENAKLRSALHDAASALRWHAIPLVTEMSQQLYRHSEPAKQLVQCLEMINATLTLKGQPS